MLRFWDWSWVCEGAAIDIEAGFVDVVIFFAELFGKVLGGDVFGGFCEAWEITVSADGFFG